MKIISKRYLFWSAISIFIFLVAPQFVFSDNNEKNAIEAKEEYADIPHPLNLYPGWVEYLDAKDSKLREHIDLLNRKLDALQGDIDPSVANSVSVLIKKIQNTLNAIPDLRNKESKGKPEDLPYRDIYNLEMQLSLVDTIYDLEQKTYAEKKEISAKQGRLSDIQNNLNKLMANYMAINGKSTERFVQGLNIISQNAQMLVLKEELRISESRLDYHETSLNNLKDELNASVSKFTPVPINSADYQKEGVGLNSNILDLRDKILEAEAAINAAPFDTEYQRAERQLMRLSVLSQKIQLTYYETSLLFWEIKNEIYNVWNDGDKLNLQDLNKKIGQWQDEIRSTSLQHEEWSAQIRQTQVEIGQGYTNLLIIPDLDKRSVEHLHDKQMEKINAIFTNLKFLKVEQLHSSHAIKQLQILLEPYMTTYQRWTDKVFKVLYGIYKVVLDMAYYSPFKIGNVPITLVVIVKAVLIILSSLMVSKFLRKTINNVASKRKNFSESNVFTIDIFIHYIVLFIGLLFAISVIGLNLSSLTIILGALSVGIGFGLQGIVNNFLCGLILLFTRNIKVGDFVELESSHWGKVVAVNVQNTIIQTYDGTDVIVPNSEMVVHKTINWTMKHGYKRLHIPFGVAYSSDKENVRKAVLEAADRVPVTVKNSAFFGDPDVWLVGFEDNALKFELVVWVNIHGKGHRGSFSSSYYWEIETSLKEYNITIPFPQRDLYLKSVPDGLLSKKAL